MIGHYLVIVPIPGVSEGSGGPGCGHHTLVQALHQGAAPLLVAEPGQARGDLRQQDTQLLRTVR